MPNACVVVHCVSRKYTYVWLWELIIDSTEMADMNGMLPYLTLHFNKGVSTAYLQHVESS